MAWSTNLAIEIHLSRGRVRHHNHALADLRHKGDAGNGQKREMARRYFANGLDAKGWRGCGMNRHARP